MHATNPRLLHLFLQEVGRLFQRQQARQTVMKRRQRGCGDVIQVFSVLHLPVLSRDVLPLVEPSNTIKSLAIYNHNNVAKLTELFKCCLWKNKNTHAFGLNFGLMPGLVLSMLSGTIQLYCFFCAWALKK